MDGDSDARDLPAGAFTVWVGGMRTAIRAGGPSDVPCDGCTACCTASQFVHIAPDERDTLAHIPRALLFPAPGLPAGHVLMGYDDAGRCPMLVDNRCSIYGHRPRTCRTYDCRVFPAAGVDPEADGKPGIAARARRWRFGIDSAEDIRRLAATRAAADFLRAHPEVHPDQRVPPTATRLAVLAVEVHDLFLDGEPRPDAVRSALAPPPRP